MPHAPLGTALHAAIAAVRTQAGDPVAPVVLLVPAAANGVLARQQLALAGPYVRVDVLTPEALVQALGTPALAARGLRPEPAGWLEATVADAVRRRADALGRHAATLRQPGWSRALATALDGLEQAGLGPEALEGDGPDPERRQLLALLLHEVRAARAADRLHGPAALHAEARARAGDGRWAGAVVLGDRLLPHGLGGALGAWAAARPRVEVQPAPWSTLAPAPGGLRAVCDATPAPVAVAPAVGAVGHLATHLFAAPAPAEPDATLAWVRTPDDGRELAEATREVLEAVEAGVPLDRIAVVLPDAAGVDTLRGHFDRAGLPATWLVGPPLATTPAARFLLHLLAIAGGDTSTTAWYDLLRQPGLRLRHRFGEPVARSRGRWRRLLHDADAAGSTATLRAALRHHADGLDPERPGAEPRREAAEHLLTALEGLDAELAPLGAPASLGAHAQRWAERLRALWVPSPDREQVLETLRGWGPPDAGRPVAFAAALAHLRDALTQQTVRSGSLMDPTVRVLTPMALLGGAFERVIATGLTEGRFPRRPAEDPLLPDDLLRHLATTHGVHLATSADVARFATRRFASVVGACTGRLWLSAPATELLDERPLLPSRLLLDAATAVLGRRARYADLAALQRPVGSRARPWPDRPEQAIGPLEHRIATAATGGAHATARLVRHLGTRRLVALHRAGARAERAPHTGDLGTTPLPFPALDGEPLSPWDLARLADDPGRFLVQTLLRIRPLGDLPSAGALDARWRRSALRKAIQAVDADPADAREAILAALDEALARHAAFRDGLDDDALATARAQAALALDAVLDRLPRGRRQPVEAPVDPALPWVVRTELGWTDGAVLAHVHYKKPAGKQLLRDAPEVVAAALATGAREAWVVAPDGGTFREPVAEPAAALRERLATVTALVREGFFPATARHGVHLATDPVFDLSEDHP